MTNKRQSGLRLALGIAVLLVIGISNGRLSANPVTYYFNHEFSSGTSPASPTTPWLTAVFQDVAPGTVSLTLTAPHLTGSEFVSGWYFNLNPVLDPTLLTFSAPASLNYALPGISESVNAFKADGDGKYDVLLSFSTSGG